MYGLSLPGSSTTGFSDIDRATQRNGGRNNAYTNEDMTVYHFDFATDRLPIALEIEADRMRNVRIDAKHEFEQEKGAVIAERLGMSEHTLRNHLNAIYDKLGIHGRVELFIYASAHGLCGREPADQQPDLRLSARGSASGRS